MRMSQALAGAAVFVAVAGAISVWAQTTTVDAGSLAALTAEVRQLRIAVEESGRAQTEAQGLGVYLSAQQSRMVQISNQLQPVRAELDTVTVSGQQLAAAIADTQRAIGQASDPRGRAELQAALQELQTRAKTAGATADRLRQRESALQQAMSDEEARWASLIARLEQTITRK